jgi:hypothetical protein
MPTMDATAETATSETRIGPIPSPVADVVVAAFYGVLGARVPYATSSGVEAFVGCHALNCYN